MLADRVRQLTERKSQPAPAETAQHNLNERAERRPLFRQGVLILGSGEKLSVAVKNVSNTGARIEFFVRTTLPDEVLLIEPTLNIRRRARVVWQRDGVAGLRFVEQ